MANEITASASLEFLKNSASDSMSISSLSINMAGSRSLHNIQNVGTSEEAITLGDLTAGGGWFFFINRDETNYVDIRQATSASDFLRLKPGEFACGRFSTDCTAPYAIADTAACNLEYLLIEA